jgi:hypothetical protein
LAVSTPSFDVAAAEPKTVLSLDGGGVRGIISVAFLERIEHLRRSARATTERPPDSSMADDFDLIGGTSTGAVIGTCLALGLPIAEVRDFYMRLAPRVFRRSRWRIAGLQTVFDSRSLQKEIDAVIGDRRLDTADLRTKLAIITKRVDTGGTWIVTNNPAAKYWRDAADGSYIGNARYRLGSLVRASTAAPFFFAPEPIAIVDGQPQGLFVDGGITPHNNPSLALLQVATIPAFGFGWPAGASRLRIVSIGTGSFRTRLDPRAALRMWAAGLAVKALMSMVSDNAEQVLAIMQLLGKAETRWPINTELGDLGGFVLPAEPLFTFCRYDVRLEPEWLRRELGLAMGSADVARLQRMDLAANVPLAYDIGVAAAERFVRLEHVFGERYADRGAHG